MNKACILAITMMVLCSQAVPVPQFGFGFNNWYQPPVFAPPFINPWQPAIPAPLDFNQIMSQAGAGNGVSMVSSGGGTMVSTGGLGGTFISGGGPGDGFVSSGGSMMSTSSFGTGEGNNYQKTVIMSSRNDGDKTKTYIWSDDNGKKEMKEIVSR